MLVVVRADAGGIHPGAKLLSGRRNLVKPRGIPSLVFELHIEVVAVGTMPGTLDVAGFDLLSWNGVH